MIMMSFSERYVIKRGLIDTAIMISIIIAIKHFIRLGAWMEWTTNIFIFFLVIFFMWNLFDAMKLWHQNKLKENSSEEQKRKTYEEKN